MYPQGRMSHHFREMRVGDYLAVRGPKVNLVFSFVPSFQGFPFSSQLIIFESSFLYEGHVLVSLFCFIVYCSNINFEFIVCLYQIKTCNFDSSPLRHDCFQGRFKYQPGEVRAFGMLAGGSGITPMFQVYH